MARQVDLEDSNIALLGSDLDREVKKTAAECEEQWRTVQAKEGLTIWRIEQFAVRPWKKKHYGSFYDGDSYIILKCYKDEESEALCYNLHFWIGGESTQDEYGTAAYKTVELDTFLDDKAVQYREVQGNESDLFNSYFKGGIKIWHGGVDSGFNHAEPDTYIKRLLWVKGKPGKVTLQQVVPAGTRKGEQPRLSTSMMNHGDAFILDLGLKLYVWAGESANIFEKREAPVLAANQITADRGEAKVINLNGSADEADEKDFWSQFDDGTAADVQPASAVASDLDAAKQSNVLWRVTDEGGRLESREEARGDIHLDMLDSDDVFVLSVPEADRAFVWVGKGASVQEKKQAMSKAVLLLSQGSADKGKSLKTQITRVVEGQKNKDFTRVVSDKPSKGEVVQGKRPKKQKKARRCTIL